MNILAVVPARGGSKGILHKNLVSCAGKPLLQWTLEAAKESRLLTHIVLSSDNDEMLALGEQFGVICTKRPPELALDGTSTEAVIGDVLGDYKEKKIELVVLLQPTSPVRTGGQIDEAIAQLQLDNADSLLSVVPSHAFLWQGKDDWFVPTYVLNMRPTRQSMRDRQYEESGNIYVFTMNHWKNTRNRLGGKISLYRMGEESRIQVDTPLDLFLVDKILSMRENGVNFDS